VITAAAADWYTLKRSSATSTALWALLRRHVCTAHVIAKAQATAATAALTYFHS
jgi:hypothetical protein